ncbi:MAG: mechanosensitive ion channel domain-containing protein [Synechococcales bacterium]|nr:mechanosensitive ion channel domain-containing protein [Synechococcales bacterium]
MGWAIALFLTLLPLGIGHFPIAATELPPLTTAQSTNASDPISPLAAVVVDGRELFYLRSIDGFPAEFRAAFANRVLQEEIDRTPLSEAIAVRMVPQNSAITLRVNDRHLLTVTDQDLGMLDLPTEEQAQAWADQLTQELSQAQMERSPKYQRRALIIGGVILVGAIAVYALLGQLRRFVCRYAAQRQRDEVPVTWFSHGTVRLLLPSGTLLLQILLGLGVGVYLTNLLPQLRSWRYVAQNFLAETFTAPIFILNDQGYSALDVVKFLALAVGLWMAVRGVTLIVKSRLLGAIGANRSFQDGIAILLQLVLNTLGLLVLLQILGVDVSSIALLASVLGVGIGFGLQNIANNLISGLIILLERPVQVGDFVSLGDLAGTVERIGARSTEIRTLDLVTIIVPNSEFIENKVVNWSHGHPVSRLHIPLGVAYQSDVKQVHTAVLQAAEAHPEVLRFPKPKLWFQGFGDSSLDFELLVWIREPRHQFQVRSDLYYLIEANLRCHQIEIPFPQRDLHLRSPALESLTALLRPDGVPPINGTATANKSIPPRQSMLSELTAWADFLRQQDGLSERDVQTLMEEMRGPQGVEIRDRRYGLRLFPRCFIGSEAVSWLVQTQNTTREEAVRIGQQLIERCVIHHVTDEHSFKDEYLFYRFYADESKAPSRPT